MNRTTAACQVCGCDIAHFLKPWKEEEEEEEVVVVVLPPHV